MMKKRLITIVVVFAALMMLQPAALIRAVAAPRAESTLVVTDEDVKLFPNPVEEELSVLCEKYDIERLMVFGSTGELVFNIPMTITQGSRTTINMSSRATGYYTVKVWVKGAKQPLTSRIYKM